MEHALAARRILVLFPSGALPFGVLLALVSTDFQPLRAARAMNHFELRSIRQLSVADVLELSGDVRLFRVMHIDGDGPTGTRKIKVLSTDGKTRVTLTRQPGDQVRVARNH